MNKNIHIETNKVIKHIDKQTEINNHNTYILYSIDCMIHHAKCNSPLKYSNANEK